MKIIRDFEKIGKVPYVKRIPKHDPTSSYFHVVRQLAKCMMISDEQNRHVHGSYMGKTAPSPNVNVTDEDKSKEIIVHKILSKNKSKDVSELECNIFHEILSHHNSAYVQDNDMMGLKNEEHK